MTDFGKYEIYEEIGQGSIGVVHRAFDRTLDRMVALKLLYPTLAADNHFLENFLRETHLVARLEHPNIVIVHENGEINGRFYQAMRWYTGGSLADRLKNGPLGEQVARYILAQVCVGVQAVLAAGLVHLDLKPANILFDAAGNAVVSDFGLGRAFSPSPSPSSTAGAAASFYRAPELWRGKPPASPAADVYSMGCMLAEMLTGLSPFRGDTVTAVIARHLVDGPDFGPGWTEMPAELTKVVEKAIDRDPSKRYPDVGAFGSTLEEAFHPAPSIQGSSPAPQPPSNLSAADLHQASALRSYSVPPALVPQEKPAPRTSFPVIPVQPRGPDIAYRRTGVRRQLLVWIGAGILVLALIGIGLATLRNNQSAAELATAQALTQSADLLATSQVQTQVVENTQSARLASAALILTQSALSQQATSAAIASTIPPLCTAIGQTWTSPVDEMPLLCVPEGKFLMGAANSDPNAGPEEHPQHEVTLDAFWIDKTLVTNRQFQQFVQASGYHTDAEKKGSSFIFKTGIKWIDTPGINWNHLKGPGSNLNGLLDHPVVHMSWNDAKAYCEWAKRQLPSEAQWEKAARGTNGQLYPWGNADPSPDLLNYNLNIKTTTEVGKYSAGASPYGALDMAGNVWEWVADWYSSTYYSSSPSVNPGGPSTGDNRILRGGSWYVAGRFVSSSNRSWDIPDFSYDYTGFRCSR